MGSACFIRTFERLEKHIVREFIGEYENLLVLSALLANSRVVDAKKFAKLRVMKLLSEWMWYRITTI